MSDDFPIPTREESYEYSKSIWGETPRPLKTINDMYNLPPGSFTKFCKDNPEPESSPPLAPQKSWRQIYDEGYHETIFEFDRRSAESPAHDFGLRAVARESVKRFKETGIEP